MKRALLCPLALLALAGCERADNAAGPGGVSVGEARALDEAAEMVDARRMPNDLLRPGQIVQGSATPAAATPAAATPAAAPPAPQTAPNPGSPAPARP